MIFICFFTDISILLVPQCWYWNIDSLDVPTFLQLVNLIMGEVQNLQYREAEQILYPSDMIVADCQKSINIYTFITLCVLCVCMRACVYVCVRARVCVYICNCVCSNRNLILYYHYVMRLNYKKTLLS